MTATITGASGRRLGIALALLLACGALLAQLAAAPGADAKSVTYRHKTFSLDGANAKRRLTVRCPGHLVPLGGGMNSFPLPESDGEGVYPHSYERLGVQHGYHSTVVLFDPSPASTTAAHRHAPGRLRPQAEARHPSAHDRLRQPRADEDRRGHLPGEQAAVRRRLPAHGLHGARRRLHHGVPGDLRQVMERHGPRVRRLRRPADRDRVLLAQQEAAAHRGLGLRKRGRRPVRDRVDPVLPGRTHRLRRLQHLAGRVRSSSPTGSSPAQAAGRHPR